MTQPVSGMSDRPPGSGEPPLTTQQRTALERLITRPVALTSQQNAEVWACVKHDLSLKTTRRCWQAILPPPSTA